MLQVRIRPILCQHQFLPGIIFFQTFHPRLNILYLSFIPAKVAVHSLNICILVHRMFCMSIPVYSCCITVRIIRLTYIMQRTGQCSCVTMRMIHLIMNSPNINGRVIKILSDQFSHLLMGIIPFLPRHPIYKRNLSPDYQSQTIAFGIHILCLLIMCQANGSSSNIHNHSQIRVMFLICQRTAFSPPVLMAGYSIHGIFLSIQEETFPGYNFIFTDTQRLYHFINHPSLLLQTGYYLI